MGQDYFDYLNRADFNVVKAACQLAICGDGEDAEFQSSIAAVLERIAKRHGLERHYSPARAPFSEAHEVGHLMLYMEQVCRDGCEKASALSDLRGGVNRRSSA